MAADRVYHGLSAPAGTRYAPLIPNVRKTFTAIRLAILLRREICRATSDTENLGRFIDSGERLERGSYRTVTCWYLFHTCTSGPRGTKQDPDFSRPATTSRAQLLRLAMAMRCSVADAAIGRTANAKSWETDMGFFDKLSGRAKKNDDHDRSTDRPPINGTQAPPPKQISQKATTPSRRRPDWRPQMVLLSTFDNWCSFCGKEIVELRHRLAPTSEYGWIHFACAGELESQDAAPKQRVAAPLKPAPVKYRCHGIMVRKKVGCEKTTKTKPVASDGSEVNHYCKQHENQRPDGYPQPVPPPAVYPLETWHVAGESFAPNYPASLHRLATTLAATDGKTEAVPTILRRDPSHEHDENAVEVHVPLLGHEVGYLERDDASRVATRLDEGEQLQAWVTAVLFKDDKPENVGVRVSVRRVA